ncbi:hypothetical protein ACFL2V_01540 [Pseudomonadota bacterium]
MSSYNLAGGLNVTAMNTLSQRLYTALYPAVFSKTLKIDSDPAVTVTYDIKQALAFDFSPSEISQNFLKEYIDEKFEKPEDRTQAYEYVKSDVVTLGVEVSAIDLSIEKKPGDEPALANASIRGGAIVKFSQENEMFVEIVKAEMKTPDDFDVSAEMINTLVLPSILEDLNKLLNEGFKIPPLDLGAITLSPPKLAIQDKTLVAVTALAEQGATEATASAPWPENRFFAGFDKQLINAVLKTFESSLYKSDHIEGAIIVVPVFANYSVGLRDLDFNIGKGNAGSLGFHATGGGSVGINMGLFTVDLGFRVSADPTANVALEVVGNDVQFVVQSVVDFVPVITFTFIPDIVSHMISGVINFLTSPIQMMISNLIIGGLSGSMLTLQPIPVEIDGKSITISLNDMKINSIADSTGRPLLVVESDMNVVA